MASCTWLWLVLVPAVFVSFWVMAMEALVATTSFNALSGTTSIAEGDFDGDGKPDLAISHFNTNSISILLGNGTRGFGLQPNRRKLRNKEGVWIPIETRRPFSKRSLALS